MELYKLNEIEQQMSDDMKWAFHSAEVQQHQGKLVAVYKKRIVGVGTDQDSLVKEAAKQERCFWGDIVVVAIPSTEILEIPH
ncbi:MAG TPA: hypothetical protein VE988_06580 [Gemmataceae bacterium]|nr:hypothetical protein [Gemmataceae bacterium]